MRGRVVDHDPVVDTGGRVLGLALRVRHGAHVRPEAGVALRRRPHALVHLVEDERVVGERLDHARAVESALPLHAHRRIPEELAELVAGDAAHGVRGLERIEHDAVLLELASVDLHLAVGAEQLPHVRVEVVLQVVLEVLLYDALDLVAEAMLRHGGQLVAAHQALEGGEAAVLGLLERVQSAVDGVEELLLLELTVGSFLEVGPGYHERLLGLELDRELLDLLFELLALVDLFVEALLEEGLALLHQLDAVRHVVQYAGRGGLERERLALEVGRHERVVLEARSIGRRQAHRLHAVCQNAEKSRIEKGLLSTLLQMIFGYNNNKLTLQ